MTNLDQSLWLSYTGRLSEVRSLDKVNLYEAKTNLSALVDRAAAGEEIVIAKAGRPLARLVPMVTQTGTRELGFLAGQVWVGDNFDDPLDDETMRAFNGEFP